VKDPGILKSSTMTGSGLAFILYGECGRKTEGGLDQGELSGLKGVAGERPGNPKILDHDGIGARFYTLRRVWKMRWKGFPSAQLLIPVRPHTPDTGVGMSRDHRPGDTEISENGP